MIREPLDVDFVVVPGRWSDKELAEFRAIMNKKKMQSRRRKLKKQLQEEAKLKASSTK
ncbi:MAG: hypothetical protein JNL32_00120 [Candidatus Kapabacteria bacterium]|nr:hypothetical protein [Candidatus Kapabacteria bacterium]